MAKVTHDLPPPDALDAAGPRAPEPAELDAEWARVSRRLAVRPPPPPRCLPLPCCKTLVDARHPRLLLSVVGQPADGVAHKVRAARTAQVLAALLERLSDAVCRRPGARAALQQAGGADPPTRSAQR
jgi:hypothetical protein